MTKTPQKIRILQVLRDNCGTWVSGQFFLREMYISQYHARIWDLQKEGYWIEASKETDEFGFKAYKLIPQQSPLL
jgi:hypothetical protein